MSKQEEEKKIIQNSIYEKILKILHPYVYKPSMDISEEKLVPVQNIKVRTPFNTLIELPLSEYVQITNLTLQEFHTDYYEGVYKMVQVSDNCIGKITIQKLVQDGINYFFFYVYEINKYIHMDPTNISDKNQIKKYFNDEFLKRYTECKSPLTSISVGISTEFEGHNNILFILTSKKSIYLYMYEPHGTIGIENDYQDIREKLINSIKTILSSSRNDKLYQRKRMPDGTIRRIKRKDIIVVPFDKISCYIGLQTYIKDSQGLCFLISFFWLYILLQLMKVCTNDEKVFIIQNINFIEDSVMYTYGPEETYNIIIYFAYNMFSNCKIDDINKFKKVFKKVFEKERIEIFTQINTDTPHSKERRSVTYNTDTYYEWFNKIYDDWSRKYQKYWTHRDEQYIIKKDREYIRRNQLNRKEDGSYCQKHKDCISDHCVNNKCKPYIRGEIGSDCKTDDQCISDYCDTQDYKCKVYKYNEDDKPDKPLTRPYKKYLKKERHTYHPYFK